MSAIDFLSFLDRHNNDNINFTIEVSYFDPILHRISAVSKLDSKNISLIKSLIEIEAKKEYKQKLENLLKDYKKVI